jgi:glycosyltransferase involved in cell wall biosynthesis
MNVLFVNYYDFTSNSAVHIFNFANELERLGISCAVAVPGNKKSVKSLGKPLFRVLDFENARARGVPFDGDQAPTLIHAWTPRENVRALTEELVGRYGWPYVVHLEDNEDVITAQHLGIPVDTLRSLPTEALTGRVPPTLSHPHLWRGLVKGSAGVSVIIDRLLEFKPQRLPGEVVWPGLDGDLFTARPPDERLKRRLELKNEEFVTVYHGNSHSTNASEIRNLYLAVEAVNRHGIPLRLIRLGRDFVDFLGSERSMVERHVISGGFVARRKLGSYLSLADVLIQPGGPDAFNNYRLPAKLPEYLSTGRPVILPAANIGLYLRDGENCLLLKEGSPQEIAGCVECLLDDPLLRERIGTAGRSFARENFSWPRSATRLMHLYEHALHHG